jgi:XRE family transcriptional regulator of biofilm formation
MNEVSACEFHHNESLVKWKMKVIASSFISMNTATASRLMNIGARIKTLRLEKGLTLPQLADEAEVAIGLLSQLEKAEDSKANPNLQTLRKIAKALEVTVADLLGKAVAMSRAGAPPKLDPELTKFLEQCRKSGEPVDEGVVQALYVLQEREGAPKTADDWHFLYRTIKMTFDARRRQ